MGAGQNAMLQISAYRLNAGAAILGAIGLFGGTLLHPMHADPNVPTAAFAEYASDNVWVFSHFLQFIGMLLMVWVLVWLSKRLSSVWAVWGATLAMASLGLAGALQAVDGVALKMMVNQWAVAVGPEKQMLFYATLDVRQIEIGLASLVSFGLGLTVILYSLAFSVERIFARWLNWLALVGGGATLVASGMMAVSGFSAEVMNVNMPASLALLVWMLAIGVGLWSQASVAKINKSALNFQ